MSRIHDDGFSVDEFERVAYEAVISSCPQETREDFVNYALENVEAVFEEHDAPGFTDPKERLVILQDTAFAIAMLAASTYDPNAEYNLSDALREAIEYIREMKVVPNG